MDELRENARRPAQHFIQNGAEREDIGPRVYVLAFGLGSGDM